MKQRKKIEKMNESKSCFFEKISKTDKTSASLTKKKEDSTKLKVNEGILLLTLQK